MKWRAGLVLLALVTAASAARPAHAEWWVLERRPTYFAPIIANVRADEIKVTFPALAPAVQYAQKPGNRLVWDISVGQELPIAGYETENTASAPPTKGNWGIGFWFPISFHVLEDFKDDSAPPIDTDYRFGGMFKVGVGVSPQHRLGLLVHVGHESTHLGDEFTLHARQADGAAFRRINVSYQFVNVGIEWQCEHDLLKLRFQAGALVVAFTDPNSWYSTTPLEAGNAPILGSKRNYEPYLRGELVYHEPLLWGFGPFVSVDVTNRVVFDYDKTAANQRESARLSVNLLIGGRSMRVGRSQDFSLRVYYGVNPFGQFRNNTGFWLLGLGWHFGV